MRPSREPIDPFHVRLESFSRLYPEMDSRVVYALASQFEPHHPVVEKVKKGIKGSKPTFSVLL